MKITEIGGEWRRSALLAKMGRELTLWDLLCEGEEEEVEKLEEDLEV